MADRRNVDKDLIAAFNKGDASAFDDLVLKHRGRLTRLIIRMTKERCVAEDIVQEAFLKVYFALPKFRGDSTFFTWLYRIAVNTLKSRKTDAQRLATAEQPVLIFPAASQFIWEIDTDTPASILESKQTLASLGIILGRMESIYSEPLLMFELEGMTYSEIAAVFACPVGTVRSRIARGRALIAEIIRV